MMVSQADFFVGASAPHTRLDGRKGLHYSCTAEHRPAPMDRGIESGTVCTRQGMPLERPRHGRSPASINYCLLSIGDVFRYR